MIVSGCGQARQQDGFREYNLKQIIAKTKAHCENKRKEDEDKEMQRYLMEERDCTKASDKLHNIALQTKKTLAGTHCAHCNQHTKPGFLLDHQQICPKTRIPCPLGCPLFFPRETLSDHYNTCESYLTRCMGYEGRWATKKDIFLDYYTNVEAARHTHLRYLQLKAKELDEVGYGGEGSLLLLGKDVRSLVYERLVFVSRSQEVRFVDDVPTTLCPPGRSLACGYPDYYTLMLLSLTCRSIYAEIHQVKAWSAGIMCEVKKIQKPKCPCCAIPLHFGQFEKHFEHCPKNILVCPYCIQEFLRADMMEHLKEHDGVGISIDPQSHQLVTCSIRVLQYNSFRIYN
eukprot:TRINITY_DN16430_c0_g1_i1.p1 TRINITY_DN16430_c0_g1~~TRINITY_DN16430_c0_g1_i1.p1  ORF type:complete len:343 (-),score=72.91 TRINITY_DN16430_c0_g1_i1:33-1061(-)